MDRTISYHCCQYIQLFHRMATISCIVFHCDDTNSFCYISSDWYSISDHRNSRISIHQAIGASADELSSMIHWFLLSYPSGLWVLSVLKCFSDNWSLLGGICLTVSGVSIVVLMSSYYLFRHKLDTTPHITNPIKLIFKVLNYARKTKYPENRSALTY